MFLYETMEEGTPLLLGGIPKAWFAKGFSAIGIGTSFSKINIKADKGSVSLKFSALPKKPIRLILRHLDSKNILEGAEHITSIKKNIILLAPKPKTFTLEIS